jgi:hypothetical protein
MHRIFALNFTLYSAQAASAGARDFLAGRTPEDCWTGTQAARR